MGTNQGVEGHDPDAPPPGTESPSREIVQFSPTTPVAGERNESAAAVLGAREAASIQARTIVAMNRPRNVENVRARLLATCKRFRFADAAVYEKPVGGGKNATGLSIRFAEEAAREWKNLDVAIGIIAEDDEGRTIEGTAVDLENNLVHRAQARVPKYVERLQPRKGDEIIGERLNSRNVKTYKIRASDDALFTEHQKHAAKLRREIILAHIPADIKEECEETMAATMSEIGGKDPDAFRNQMLNAFASIEVTREMIEEFLGKSASQMNVAEMFLLKRIFRGIQEGEGTWKEVMDAKHPNRAPGEVQQPSGKGDATDALKTKLGVDKKVETVPDAIAKIRAKAPKARTDDEKEELRQFEQDHPGV